VAMDLEQIKKSKLQAIQKAMTRSDGKSLLNSEYGVKLLKIELIDLFSKIDQMVNQTENDGYREIEEVIIQHRHCTLSGRKLAVQLRWDAKFKNTLEGSFLWVTLFRGNPIKRGRMWTKKPKLQEMETKKFVFHVTQTGETGWKEIDQKPKGTSLKSKQLARMAVNMLLEAMQAA